MKPHAGAAEMRLGCRAAAAAGAKHLLLLLHAAVGATHPGCRCAAGVGVMHPVRLPVA